MQNKASSVGKKVSFFTYLEWFLILLDPLNVFKMQKYGIFKKKKEVFSMIWSVSTYTCQKIDLDAKQGILGRKKVSFFFTYLEWFLILLDPLSVFKMQKYGIFKKKKQVSNMIWSVSTYTCQKIDLDAKQGILGRKKSLFLPI